MIQSEIVQNNDDDDDENKSKKKKIKPITIKTTSDLQRLKVEKLMRNPNKPVMIPEKRKERGVPTVPDFVRNVMGSSAGAGSGEFHVYRHLRRKEYARQKYMKEKGERERLDDEYHQKLEDNKQLAAERTSKKRKKRLKRNRNQGRGKKVKCEDNTSSSSESSESEEIVDKAESSDHNKLDDENELSK